MKLKEIWSFWVWSELKIHLDKELLKQFKHAMKQVSELEWSLVIINKLPLLLPNKQVFLEAIGSNLKEIAP